MDVHALIGVEFGQQQPRQFVFLESRYPGIWVDEFHRVDENTHARRRFQDILRLQIQLGHHRSDGIGNILRRVECRED